MKQRQNHINDLVSQIPLQIKIRDMRLIHVACLNDNNKSFFFFNLLQEPFDMYHFYAKNEATLAWFLALNIVTAVNCYSITLPWTLFWKHFLKLITKLWLIEKQETVLTLWSAYCGTFNKTNIFFKWLILKTENFPCGHRRYASDTKIYIWWCCCGQL